MRLQFFGAAGEVTGSCHILECNGQRVLLDCGLIQGGRDSEARNREPFPFDAKSIDAVVLSHAHIDHSGRLPLLVRRGYRGPIYAHNATCDLADILLADSANLAASRARRAARRDPKDPMAEPLYERADAKRAASQLRGLRYGQTQEVAPGIEVSFADAGHIMGSCVVQLALRDGKDTANLVFSGDLGQYDTPILNDPASFGAADALLLEHTYGGRNHRDRDETVRELGQIVRDADREGGVLLIPAFAVGRSQEILYQLGKHFEEWGLARWKVFLDSPLAIKTSHIYWDYPHLYDEEATRLKRTVDPMPILDNLHLSQSSDQSKAINQVRDRAIVIAGSGMLNGGRMLHHLKQRLGRRDTRVLFTGYQPGHSLGRRLIDGVDEVRIHGQTVPVAASMHTLGGLSAHGGQDDLLRWYRGSDSRPTVYLVHGNPDQGEALAARLRSEAGTRAFLPQPGATINLLDPGPPTGP